MAIAVAISCINALTLSPALCALIMTPHAQDGDKLSFSSRFHLAFDSAFQRLIAKYKGAVEVLFRHRWLSFILVIVAIGGLSLLMKTTKTGLVPSEDMGTVFINVQDIFNWGGRYGSTSENTNPNFLSSSTNKMLNSRYISAGITLRFGKLELEKDAKDGSSESGDSL